MAFDATKGADERPGSDNYYYFSSSMAVPDIFGSPGSSLKFLPVPRISLSSCVPISKYLAQLYQNS